jgi:exodeoxyribonuclease V beta subunit
MHAFPRGAEVGTFLHDLLEWAADTGFAAVASRPDALRDTIARRCARRGWNAWIEPMTRWAGDFLTTDFALPAVPPQGATSFRFATLERSVPEMEFWIAAGDVDALELDRLVRAHTLGAAERPALAPATLNGMLKGFIDLVLEHDGRFFVADYKSNWLGPDDAAYSAAAMRDAILAHRYELQYALYLLALHRLLKSRLPGYDYDRHVGGAVYLFLRGCRAPGHGVHFERPPRALIEALDRLFARASKGDAARPEPNSEVPA